MYLKDGVHTNPIISCQYQSWCVYNSLTSIAHSLRKILSEDCGTSQAAQGRTKPHKDAQVEFDGYVRRWRRQRPEKARGRTRLHRDAQSCTDSHKIARSLTNANKIAQIRSNAHNTAQKARERVFLSEKWCHRMGPLSAEACSHARYHHFIFPVQAKTVMY